jgi:hypothetical protein
MRAASRAAGRRAWQDTGRATGDRASMRPVRAFTSFRRRGRAPSDRRWPYRLRFVGVGVALRAPTRLQLLGLARVTVVPALGLRLALARIAAPRLVTLPTRIWHSGDLPAFPERASNEVPGCGQRLVPLCSRLGPSLGPVPRLWPRILRQPSGSLAMPRSEDRLAARLPAARDGAVSAGHLPPVQRPQVRPDRGERQEGEAGESRLRGPNTGYRPL